MSSTDQGGGKRRPVHLVPDIVIREDLVLCMRVPNPDFCINVIAARHQPCEAKKAQSNILVVEAKIRETAAGDALA